MSNNYNQISLTYTDTELRNLIEEFITQWKEEFSIRDVCSYILYWAVEDGKVANGRGLLESNELRVNDQEKVKLILDAIIADDRIKTCAYERFIKR